VEVWVVLPPPAPHADEVAWWSFMLVYLKVGAVTSVWCDVLVPVAY
jgi:hypothetical protein